MMRLLFKILRLTGLWGLMVRTGMLLSRLIPMRNQSGIFFFLPYYHIGGAEKVHADILDCFAQAKPWVIITRRSQNANYKHLFERSARLFDLWFLGFLYPVSIGLAAGFVNRHPDAVAFGCNSPFYYYLVPYLGGNVRKLDLTHAFDGLERLSLQVADSFDARIAINSKTVTDFAQQYQSHGADPRLNDGVVLIENRVDIPGQLRSRKAGGPLKVLYVGRGTVEKRAYLVGRIAWLCSEQEIPAQVTLVGRGLFDAVLDGDRKYCRFAGEISDPAELQQFYEEADVLLLTSSREGFPLVIMEAMANGAITIATNVGGISVHVTDGVNGFLVDAEDEEHVVQKIVYLLLRLSSDGEERERISRTAYMYARDHFSSETFCQSYRKVFGCGSDGQRDTIRQ